MKPSVRLLKVIVGVAVSSSAESDGGPGPADPTAETVTRWRVQLTDLDLFGHMNNSRYLLLMDYARVHYLGRLGLLGAAIRNRWVIPVGTARVEYRRALRPFEQFEIATQVLSWDERWFYMRQTFRVLEPTARVVATAHLQVPVRSRVGTVPPADVVRMAVDRDVVPPRLDARALAAFGLPAPAAPLGLLAAS